jgi:hypothetical protein
MVSTAAPLLPSGAGLVIVSRNSVLGQVSATLSDTDLVAGGGLQVDAADDASLKATNTSPGHSPPPQASSRSPPPRSSPDNAIGWDMPALTTQSSDDIDNSKGGGRRPLPTRWPW